MWEERDTFFIVVGVSRKSFIMPLTFTCEKQCLEQGWRWEEGGCTGRQECGHGSALESDVS